jgi:XTP/dITP diphosphohydrolase
VAGTHGDGVTQSPVPDGARPGPDGARPGPVGDGAKPGPVAGSAKPGADGAKPGAAGAEAGGSVPGAALLRLVEVMDTLRVNCPWDAKQTHESLAPYLLEECYEALEALEDGDRAALRDELGDVLLQVVFHARVAAERTDGTGFTIDDVATGIVEKLVRRHPHVFGDVKVSSAEDVKRNWDAIKAAERGGREGALPAALGSVPFGQPALSLAAQLQRRAERAGVPVELTDLPAGSTGPAGRVVDARVVDARAADGGAVDGRAVDGREPDGVSEIGAALFSLVARARAAGLDPELELRAAARSYRKRVRQWAEDQSPDRA